MLKTSGDEAVLLLRSELLRRYPGSIIYLCRATTGTDGLPQLDDTTLMLPGFRGDLPPDVTFVGFPIDPDELTDYQSLVVRHRATAGGAAFRPR